MTAYIILGIFVTLAALSLTVSRFRTINNAKKIKKILAHSPKDEDKLQK